MTNQTSTTFFTCLATSKVDFTTKKFFSLVPGAANKAAKEWFASQEKKAA